MTDEEINRLADELASAIYDPLFPHPSEQAIRAKAQCVRAVVEFGVTVRAAERERCAGIAEHIDHIACTQYMDSEATGKEVARCIRNE